MNMGPFLQILPNQTAPGEQPQAAVPAVSQNGDGSGFMSHLLSGSPEAQGSQTSSLDLMATPNSDLSMQAQGAQEVGVPMAPDSANLDALLKRPLTSQPNTEDQLALEGAMVGNIFTNTPKDVSPEEVIKAITKILGKGQKLIESNPTVAFVTGHLEQFQPQQIPQFVANNKFINEAVRGESVDAVLDTPIKISALLDMFGVQPSFVKQIKSLSADQSESITPRKFLSMLGVDAQNVAHELNLLKDNVQLDGFTGYMKRAQRLRGEKPVAAAERTVGPQGIEAQKDPQPETLAAAQVKPGRNWKTLNPAKPTAPAKINQPEMESRNPDLLHGKQTVETSTPVDMKPSLGEAQRISGRPGEFFSENNFSGKAQNLNVVSQPSQDPFKLMTQKLDQSANTETLSMTPKNAMTSLEENLMSQQVAGKWSEQSGKAVVEPAVVLNGPKNVNVVNAPPAEGQLISSIKTEMDSFTGQDQGSENFKEAMQNPEQNISESVAKPKPMGFAVQSEAKVADWSTPESVEKVDLVRAPIMEKVDMLVKSGGGSLKIDIGSEETGKIEVGVNVLNDKVDLKILTANDQVKEWIAQDISKLEEALSEHNLKLKDVQLGTSDKGPGQQFAKNFQESFQGQGSGQGKEAPLKGESFKPNLNPAAIHKINKMNPASKLVSQNGRIQVWA